MKIVHLSEPGSGGVKRYVVDLLRSLSVQDAHDYTLLYSLKRADRIFPAELAELRDRGVRCNEATIVPELKPWADIRSALHLAWVLFQNPPDVLHLHSSKAGGVGRLVAKLCFPSVITLYVPHAMACYRSRFYLWLERLLAPLSDRLVAVSPSEGDDFMRWRVNSGRNVHVVRIGLKEIAPVSRPAPRPEFVVAAGGRICAQKNALLFFQVALQLARTDPRWRFVWVGWFGDDAEAQAVDALLKKESSAQITVTGWVEDPEQHLRGADVFCMLSRYESFGYITAEAMLTGVPVVAIDGTGTRDLVRHNETGFVVDAEVEAICQMLAMCRANTDQLRQIASRAREFMTRQHSLAAMAKDVGALYALVEQGRRPAVI